MEWLNKLLRRRGDHDKWLAAHPGKGGFSLPPTTETDAADQARARALMESELSSDADKRAARNAASAKD